MFAFGSVLLLAINLMRGSGGVWADTAISAWAVLVLAHVLLMIIARLLQELLADEDANSIRPASEVHWNAPSTWTLPPRSREPAPSKAPPSPAPSTLDPEASAVAAAAREPLRKKPAAAEPAPQTAPGSAPVPSESDRVSWQAATDAAWLTPRDTTPGHGTTNHRMDDEDDFTPLKFD